MKGLIKKDLFILKNNAKSLVLLLLIYIVCSINADGLESFVIPFMISMLCVSTFSYDEYNKWDAYAVTLPGDRGKVVRAKYAMVLLLIALSFFVTMFLSFFLGALRGNYDFLNSLVYTFVGMGTGSLTISILYPLIIKFGLEKGRIGIMLATFGLTALIAIFSTTITLPENIVNTIENYMFIILPLVAIAFFFISYFISKHIYIKKEF